MLDRIEGCLVGGAIGDALGYPVEFIGSFKEIQRQYGKDGIIAFDLSSKHYITSEGKAVFSDDTQMTLYTAEGILHSENTGNPLKKCILDAYLAWYGPQSGKTVKLAYDSELVKIPEVNQRRAPGNTCMSALRNWYSGYEPENYSKGCGGVMRVAPIGIYGAVKGLSAEETGKLAGEVAELTHLHPLSTYSSATLAIMIHQILTTEIIERKDFIKIVDEALSTVEAIYGPDSSWMTDFKMLIHKAVSMAESTEEDWKIIEGNYWEGWVAEEALAIAIFSVTRHFDDFEACMLSAVNHGGDSDSTGAIAGNIVGAVKCYQGLPEKFTNNLQLLELIRSFAKNLQEL